MKKVFSAILLAVMMLTMTAQTARAEIGDEFTVEYVKYQVTSESPNEVQIVGYEDGVAADLVIPATVTNGSVYSVTSIYNSAFSMCSNLTSIVIPNNVTSIGESAFYNCVNLTSITIPTSVTSIGEKAFDKCIKLTSVSIPSGLTTISNSTFSNCSNLTSIVIPASVTSIGACAFSGCYNLMFVVAQRYISEGSPSITSLGGNAFEYCNALAMIFVPNAEACTAYKNDISWSQHTDKIHSISEGNNSGYCGDPKVNNGKNVYYAYYQKPNKASLIIAGSGTMETGYRPWSGFRYYINTVNIGDGVTSIGSNAFNGCAGITSIAIPASVTSIGESAFQGCGNLTSIFISASVTSIGKNAFLECNKLKKINVDVNNQNYTSEDGVLFNKDKTTLVRYPQGKSGTSYEIPASVTSIKDNAFNGCSGLTSITIPASVTSIGGAAFYECSSLTSVTIPASVTSIGDEAFLNCENLTSVIIPASVTSIGENAFDGCGKLESINVDGNNQNYVSEDGVLFNKDKTTLVRYPQGKSGTSYDILASVTSIGNNAFNGCGSLTSVTIPASVTSIGEDAFYGCTSVENVYCYADPDKLTWEEGSCDDFKNDKATQCHVIKSKLEIFNAKWNTGNAYTDVKVTFVGDIATYKVDLSANIPMSGEKSATKYSETLPDQKTLRQCYIEATGGEPDPSLEVTNVSKTSGDNVTVGTENGWDTPITITGTGTSVVTLTTNTPIMQNIPIPFTITVTESVGLSETIGLTAAVATEMAGKVGVFSRTFKAGKASTICLPFPMTDIKGGKVYEFRDVTYDATANSGAGAWVATMSDATPDGNSVTSTTANKPYLFMPSSNGEVTFSGTAANDASSYTPGTTTSNVSDGTWIFHGTYSRLEYGTAPFSGNVFGFAATTENVEGVGTVTAGEFVKAMTGAGVPPFRCYLTYSGDNSALQARAMTRGNADQVPDRITVRLIGKDGETEGIGTLSMDNGQWIIDNYYDLNGRRLNGKPTKKGLYINNGRKVVIR